MRDTAERCHETLSVQWSAAMNSEAPGCIGSAVQRMGQRSAPRGQILGGGTNFLVVAI